MALRGFENDDPHRAHSYDVDTGYVVSKVMRSGGVVRQSLMAAGIHPDTATWQGVPGIEVAQGLVEAACALDLSPDRTQYLGHCAEVLAQG